MSEPGGARALAIKVLLRVQKDQAYSNVVLDAELSRTLLDARDRRLATRIVYGALAMQRRLDARMAPFVRGEPSQKLDPWVLACLRSAVYQLEHLDRTPAHAVLNEAVELTKRRCGPKVGGFVNAVLRRIASAPPPTYTGLPPATAFGLRHSLPDEIAARALAELGADAERWASSLNVVPPMYVRCNRQRISVEALAAQLEAQPSPLSPGALRMELFSAPVRNALETGLCTVQDLGSQLVADFAEPQSARRIWDACAGQGVKSLQLYDGSLQGGVEPRLLASDLHPSKLERLRDLFGRACPQAKLETRVLDATKALPPELVDAFDLVFVDAPCSALGLLRRHPETRWRKRVDAIGALASTQARILEQAALAVAPGGLLVYAVCTTTHEETRAQVASFLARHVAFRLEPPSEFPPIHGGDGMLELSPHQHDTDGFFAARLRRVG